MSDNISPAQYGPKLAERIKEFNSAVKLGIDLGTKTGGIAVVKDNHVLAAKTFLEFHNETIEDRRLHRRNRRSRLAKRKRIAKLRSWVLRQKVNGKQLPDPYKIKDTEFYRQNKEARNWIEAVINNRNTSSEAFVRALTLVFRKRGQRYEEVAKEIADISYGELKALVGSMTSASAEEGQAIEEEIKKRQHIAETDKEAERYGKLLEALNGVAQKTDVKNRKDRKEELKKLVDAFCKSNGVGDSVRWNKELGSLIDRPVRKARFMNRILIRCTVCDKPTPKKSRSDIRKLLYQDAIRNFLRAGRIEPTSDVITYYEDIFGEAEALRAKIAKHEELSANEKKTRAAISRKINKYMNKEYGAEKQKKMLEQVKALLFGELSGRSRYCLEHLKKRAEGKDLEEGRHGHTQIKYDRNVAQQNHDKRVINLIRYLLFDPKSPAAEEVKKYGIKYITIEAPEPKTERTKKGQVPKTDTRKLKEKLFDDQGGFCIYTGTQLSRSKIEEYEKDHIFPYSRDGPSIRDNLVLTTKEVNRDKGDKTPWEWLHNDTAKWQEFEERVKKFYKMGRISDRKRDMLLNKDADFPGDNPTELARAGARINNFIAELNGLLASHGLQEAQTLFERGKPIVQVVRGNETQRLRRQWHAIDPIFIPLKDRAISFNHAEDATIAASMPPNFWRAQIYRYTWHFDNNNTERPDFAVCDIAPRWDDFVKSRTEPIISVLGKTKYGWKKHIIDDTFYLRYNEHSRFGAVYQQPVKRTAENAEKVILLKNEHEMVQSSKYYHKWFGNDRLLIKSSKGGSLVTIKPKDGSERLIQINPTYECTVMVKDKRGKIKLKYKPISPLQRMFSEGKIKSMDEELKSSLEEKFSSQKDKELRRHEIIYLSETKSHAAGYFLISKLNKSNIFIIPEDQVKVQYLYNNFNDENDVGKKQGDKKPKIRQLRLNQEDLSYLYDHPEAKALR